MIEAVGLRWIVSAVFVVAGLFCAYRCLRQGPATSRFGDVLHMVMCAGMVAMAWPATMSFARVPQLVLFGLAAAWFAGTAAWHTGRWHRGYHAVMMAAMAWMVFAMPTAMTGGGGTVDMEGMPGMAMPVGGGGSPTGVGVLALVLAAVFALAGTAFLARVIDGVRSAPPSVRTAGWGADGLMGLGMAVMLLAMT